MRFISCVFGAIPCLTSFGFHSIFAWFCSVFLTDLPYRLRFVSMVATHNSGDWYWRHAGDFPRVLANRYDGIWSADTMRFDPTPEELESVGDMFGHGLVHLLVPGASLRSQRSKYRYHVCSKQLPPGMLCRIADSVFVASPELRLAQVAGECSLIQFASQCMEFLGKYALRSEEKRGMAKRAVPLVTREALEPPLRALLGKRRYGQAMTMLQYVEGGSRSPMETRMWLLLFLPKKYGGYGLPRALLNAEIELTPEEQLETGRHHVECDLFWPEHKVAVEYDGDEDHASYENRARDASKRNVLQARETLQFTVTARQIFDVRAFDAVARDIACAIGYCLKSFPREWESRRDYMRSVLFSDLEHR